MTKNSDREPEHQSSETTDEGVSPAARQTDGHPKKKEYQKPVVGWAKLLGFGATPTVG